MDIQVTNTHVFFYGSWLSNFHKCNFIWNAFNENNRFFCTEQAFMWAKAKYFKDDVNALNILNEKYNPRVCKSYGRKVKNYIDKEWNDVRYEFMYSVNMEKYKQNDDLKTKLLNPLYKNKKFVEASPFDKIWGICLDVKKHTLDFCDNEKNWMGLNLLGKVITSVRDNLS